MVVALVVTRGCRVPLLPDVEGRREELLTLSGEVTRSKVRAGGSALPPRFVPRTILSGV